MSADKIIKLASSVARHLQTHDIGTSIRAKRIALAGCLGHPTTAINEPSALLLRTFTFRLDLLAGRIVVIREASCKQLCHGLLVARSTRRLKVGRERTVHIRTLVPIEAEPPKPVKDRLERSLDVALAVGIVNPHYELTPVVPREEPVEERRPNTADVQIARRTWSEPCTYSHEIAEDPDQLGS